MLWHFSLKEVCQIYNNLEIDKDVKILEHKFSGVEYQNFPTEYHTWDCLVFVIGASLRGGLEGIPK